MTTWKDIKLATLQKMFSSNGTTIQADSSTSEYIYAMPQAANEALQLLATAGKFIVKTLEIDVKQYANLIGDTAGFKEYYIQGEGQSMTFSAKGCHSLYLKVRGGANVTISYPYIVHDEETDEDEVQLHEERILVHSKEYMPVKRILDNPDNDFADEKEELINFLILTEEYDKDKLEVDLDPKKIREDYQKDYDRIYGDDSLNRVQKSLALKELVHMSICQVVNDIDLFFTRPFDLTPEEIAEKNKQEAKALENEMQLS